MDIETNNIKFSFVMPAYKGKFIKESVNSILEQKYSNFELIIVDDKSPDNLEEIISKYDDKRISYCENSTNIGGQDLVEQWNHSIKKASGDYIILASDDDIYGPDYLTNIYELIKKYPSINIFRCKIGRIDREGVIYSEENWDEINGNIITTQQWFDLFSREVILSGIPQYTFRRDILLANGGFVKFPKAWFSDDATVLLIGSIEGHIGISHTTDFLFRTWEESITGNSHSIEHSHDKISAGLLFYKFLKDFKISPSTHKRILNRIRALSVEQVNQGSFQELIHGLQFLNRQDSRLFPIWWSCIRFMGFIRRKLNLI